MPIPKGASLHSYDWKLVSQQAQTDPGEGSLVQQHLKEEADINTIVRRFGITGQMPFGPTGGMYGDFTGFPTDYLAALEVVDRADAAFMSLPAEVRERFHNNPAELVEFANSRSYEDFVAATTVAPGAAPVEQPAAGAPSPAGSSDTA